MNQDECKLRILIVDADASQGEIFQYWLQAMGHQCHSIDNGPKVLEYLKDSPVDLVIFDIMLPGMDGIELLRQIKEEYAEINIIVVTEDWGKYSPEDVIAADADDFMEKQAGKNVLAAKINRLIKIQKLKDACHLELNTKKVLVDLLNLSIENKSVDDFLQEFISCIVTFPWLELEPKGAVFLIDERDSRMLLLKAHYNLADPLQTTCAKVPFGKCLCGKAALSGEIVFVNSVDRDHDNFYEKMPDHGHYCVPVISAKGSRLGVFTLYTKPGVQRNDMVEKVLSAAAKTLARIITTRHDEAQIQHHEQRFKSMTENALDAIIMMDDRGHISFWNPAAKRIFGYSSADILGEDLHKIIVPRQYQAQYIPALAKFFKSGSGSAMGQTLEVSGLHKDGREIPLELSLSSYQTGTGWQAIGLIRDIASRKAMEQEKIELAEQLRQAKKMEAIGTLAGGIAHDFNNILGTIIGSADIAMDEVEPGSIVSQDLARILTAGNRAKSLVSQMLTFSRQRRKEFVPTSLQKIINRSLKAILPEIPAIITVIENIQDDTRLVQVDSEQIQQVVMNLCRNSLQAMNDSGGTLTLSLNEIVHERENSSIPVDLKLGSYLKLSVADNGYGINKEMLGRIFEPFFTTKELGAEAGMGMGLALVYSIVTDHKGKVTVATVSGKGSVFTVYLPTV